LFKRLVYLLLYNFVKRHKFVNPIHIFNEERNKVDNSREIRKEQIKLKHAHHIVRGGW
jgi:hypothetical protein